MIEVLEFWDVCQGEMHGCGASPREKCVAVSKAGREEPLSPLSSGIELQGLEMAVLSVNLALVRYFPLFLHSSLLEWQYTFCALCNNMHFSFLFGFADYN